jgi:cytochrome c553
MPVKTLLLWLSTAALAWAQTPTSVPLCNACHGPDGVSAMPNTPSLAGQPTIFIENQLVMIREGMRDVAAMNGLLKDLKDNELTALAKYYSSLPIKSAVAKVDAEKVARGAALSKRGVCGSCHLPSYAGREQMPRLAAQREDFLLASMQQFRDGKAVGRDTMMNSVLRGVSDAELSDLAHYFATK